MPSTDTKISEIFIPGPAGRLEAKYFKSKKTLLLLLWYFTHILNMEEQ